MLIKPNTTVLFQGDSITDAGRIRETDSLGNGYPFMIANMFTAKYPTYNVKFINKGISGNRAIDLKNRWTEDCISLKPDYLSLLIGINDTWRRYDSQDATSAESYYDNVKSILTRTKMEVGDIPIILLEPFVMPYPEDRKEWRVDLDPKIQKLREIAKEFKATYIPLDGIFAANSIDVDSTLWSGDGVHPTPVGHAFIADLWIKAVENK